MVLSWKRHTKILLWLALSAYAIHRRAEIFHLLSVFSFSGIFTLVLSPLCMSLERNGVKASWAAFVSVSALVVILLAAMAYFFPYLISHLVELYTRNAETINALIQQFTRLSSYFGLQYIIPQNQGVPFSTLISDAMALVARTGLSAASYTGRLLFSLVIAYYALQERANLSNHLLLCLPPSWRTAFLAAALACKNTILSYASGLAKTSLFVCAATGIGLFFLGIEDALVLSLFMGILEVFPYVGPILASIPILLSAAAEGFKQTVLASILIIAVQQAESNFIGPYFTESTVSLHPLASLLSVFVFGSFWGIWGILLAIPAVIVFRSVIWSLVKAVPDAD